MTYYANGTEGAELDAQCMNCQIGIEKYCPIAHIQYEFNYKQFGKDRFQGYLSPTINAILNTLICNGECRMKKCIDDMKIPGYQIKNN